MLKNAKHSLEAARLSEEHRFFNSMNVLVYCAFTLEAFFNHLGKHLHKDWEEIERDIPKFKKLKKLSKEVGVTSDFSSTPYTSVKEVFAFRYSLAHGRTEVIEKDNPQLIGSDWMNMCTLDNAERIFADTKSVISGLYKASGLGEHPFFILTW